SWHRCGDALYLNGAEIAVFEQIADQPASACGDNDGIRLGERLQTGREVRCFADDRLLLRRALADQIADDDEPRGNAGARSQLDGFGTETADSIDQTQRGSDGPLAAVFRCSRITKIGQDTVARVLPDKAVEPADRVRDALVVSADHFAQILRV